MLAGATVAVLLVMLFCLPWVASAQAPAGDGEGEAVEPPSPEEKARAVLEQLDSQTLARWRRHFGIYASKIRPFEGDYVIVPSYDPRYDSSRLLDTSGAKRELAERRRVYVGPNLTKVRTAAPPLEDIEPYIRTIPRLDLGEWGYIHSAEIEQVIDDDQMVIKDLWLVDADGLRDEKDRRYDDMREQLEQEAERQRRITGRRPRVDFGMIRELLDFEYQQREALADLQRDRSFREPIRLVGFSTAGLIERVRWKGPGGTGAQIAIVKMEEYDKKGKTRLVAVPARWFREGLDEASFIQMLEQRQMTVPEFVQFMQDVKLADPEDADDRIFRVLMPAIDRFED